MSDCIFCKIINGELPTNKVYEDENVLAIRDIKPAAPVHVLVMPKAHIESLNSLDESNMEIVKPIHNAIQKVAEKEGIKETGYRVIVNCGKGAGQTVSHLHYHVIGGVQMSEELL